MMMDAVAEPYTFEVGGHGLEVIRVAVTFVFAVDCLQHFANAQIVRPVLVKQNVTSI